MSVLTFGKMLQWSPLIQVLFLAFGTLLSFIMAYQRGDVNLYLPFISETGAYSPEKCIFSLFLIIGSFIGLIIIFFRFMIIRNSKLNEDKKFLILNKSSLFTGIISMIGLAGVAAFPMTTVFWAHLVAATLYFLGSAVYFIFGTIMTYKMDTNSKIFTVRCLLTVTMMILLMLLVICFPISLHRWHSKNNFIPALKEPVNEGFTLLFISSVLEWAVVGVIIAYNLSFIMEFKNHCLHIAISPEEYKNNAADEDPPIAAEDPS